MNKLKDSFSLYGLPLLWAALLGMPSVAAAQAAQLTGRETRIQSGLVGKRLMVGDVVFIRIPALPFKKVASTTGSWTNHVGIVTDVSGGEPLIAESRFPLSGKTTWSRFAARSENGRVAVSRLGFELNQQQRGRIGKAAASRSGVLYDTGFDLHSHRQFCSRYVREVLDEALGVKIGQVENFAALLNKNPQADLSFWRMWYFGYIPWQRETVTPASLLNDPVMHTVFNGYISQ